MTEPVAYRVDGTIYNNANDAEYAVRETEHLRNALGIDNGLIRKPVYIEPLYTSEQLHPRVKMTKKQYDRLMWDKQNTDLFQCIGYFLEHDGVNKFGLPSENLMGFLTQEDIAQAWLNPEETIEIIPDMKWFVRSKSRDDEGDYAFLSGIETPDAWGYSKRHDGVNDTRACAYAFDTQDEAELWVTPITKAVQLPVEDK